MSVLKAVSDKEVSEKSVADEADKRKPSVFKGLVSEINISAIWRRISTTFLPVVIGLISHYGIIWLGNFWPTLVVPGWSAPIDFTQLPDLRVWPAVIPGFVFMAAWHYYNIKFIRDAGTAVKSLRDENRISTNMGFLAAFIGAFALARGQLYFAMLAPIFYQIQDARHTSDEAINNASTKSTLQSR